MEPTPDPANITSILQRLAAGDSRAEEQLFPAVYEELRHLAGWFLRRERPGHTLQPTALVHEAYLRMIGQLTTDWKSRTHFFGVAASVMRRILTDHARKHLTEKRGGGLPVVPLDEAIVITEDRLDYLLSLDRALTRLSEIDGRQAKIVEMRFFGGLTEEEIGLLLGLSSRTVKRDWVFAKAWLQAELSGVGAKS